MVCTVCLAQPPAEQHVLLQALQVQCCTTGKRECRNDHRSVQCNLGHIVQPMTTAFPGQCLQTTTAESSIYLSPQWIAQLHPTESQIMSSMRQHMCNYPIVTAHHSLTYRQKIPGAKSCSQCWQVCPRCSQCLVRLAICDRRCCCLPA